MPLTGNDIYVLFSLHPSGRYVKGNTRGTLDREFQKRRRKVEKTTRAFWYTDIENNQSNSKRVSHVIVCFVFFLPTVWFLFFSFNVLKANQGLPHTTNQKRRRRQRRRWSETWERFPRSPQKNVILSSLWTVPLSLPCVYPERYSKKPMRKSSSATQHGGSTSSTANPHTAPQFIFSSLFHLSVFSLLLQTDI